MTREASTARSRSLHSWWDGAQLGYVAARRTIYVPLYARAVIDTVAYERLTEIYASCDRLVLWDFDGYDHRAAGATYADVLHDPAKIMGHAFVLAMLLERVLLWNPHRTALWMRLA